MILLPSRNPARVMAESAGVSPTLENDPAASESQAALEGANTIRFRFNYSNGIVSGFRVLALDLLAGDSTSVEPDLFIQDDRDTWAPPLRDSGAERAGAVGERATVTRRLQGLSMIARHCSDCHARDGRDLKYFCFSNASIIVRSRFHGLSDLQGEQIASYIRSLPVPSPGRPWNPLPQPRSRIGCSTSRQLGSRSRAGLDPRQRQQHPSLPLGANVDRATPSPQVAIGKDLDWTALVPQITREPFRPDGNFNVREIPISLQLPDWNHWLPQLHPLEHAVRPLGKVSSPNGTGPLAALNRRRESTSQRIKAVSTQSPGGAGSQRIDFVRPDRHVLRQVARCATRIPETVRGGQLRELDARFGCQSVFHSALATGAKTWEVTQESGLEARGRELFGPDGGTSRLVQHDSRGHGSSHGQHS